MVSPGGACMIQLQLILFPYGVLPSYPGDEILPEDDVYSFVLP